MHTRMKSHLSKFYSKKKDIKGSSVFYKHLINKHGGMSTGTTEQGTFMINIKGEL